MRILIAGCNGLLGQNLLRTAPEGHELLGMARHSGAVLADRLNSYHAADIADPATWEFVRNVLRPDFIFNAAAYTDVDGCERDLETARRVNLDAVRAMADTGIPLVHLSTDYVFDGTAGPYGEDDIVNPLSVYGRIKLESEAAALLGSPKNLVVRTMWVWGSGKGAKKSFTDFVHETLQAGKPARIVSDQIGNPTLAEDLALAIWVLVGSDRSGIYHVSGSDRVSRLDWARAVARFYGLSEYSNDDEHAALITPVTTAELNLPAARPLQSGLRGDKLERDTGLVLGGLEAQLQDHRAAAE